MNRIITESELVGKLFEDVRNTEKSGVKILAGHLPLLYLDNGPGNRNAQLGVERWGEFSNYSFDLGCRIAKYCKEIGKNTGLILVVDDDDELRRSGNGSKWSSARKRFYSDSNIPPQYLSTLEKYGLDESYISKIEDDYGNITPLVSERLVKRRAENLGLVAPNECSKAYKGILLGGQLFDKEKDYLVSFIPGQCKGNICAGVLDENEIDFDSSHVFFPHAQRMGGLVVEDGKYVQKTAPWTKEMIFGNGVEYVKT